MEKQIRQNRIIMLVMLLLSLISSFFLVSYLVNHVGETADREALAHVTENTEQLKYSFKNRIEDTWAIMKLESRSISEHTASQSDALKAISLLEETSEAHRVYLISKEGKYLDGSGNTGEWQLDAELLSLLRGGEPLCRLRQPDTGGDRLDFAILLERPATEQGYTVLLMEYQLDTFLETLELHAYGGQAIAYVVNGNGSTLFHTEGTLPAGHPQNYFFYQFFGDMTFEGNDQVTDVASLRETVEKGQTGAVYVSDREYSYALSFLPLDINDWSLLVMAERSAIAGGRMEYMRQVQWIAIGVNLVIMLLCLAFYFINSLWLRRRTDRQLSSRERIINVLSSNSQGVYLLLDASGGKCTFVSSSIESMLGFSPSEILNKSVKPLLDLFHDRETEQALRDWDCKTIFDSERFLFGGEDGTEPKYLRIRAFPPQNNEVLLAVLDETVDAQREHALEDAVNMARSANQAKSMFLSNMSHDIRTPMNAIIGFTTLALTNVENQEKVKDYLGKILSSGNHLLSLINDVLDMSRIESGKLHLEEQAVHLSDVFHDLKTIISGQVYAKQLELYMDIMDVTDEDVYCDKTRLNQLLLNLLSNAVKFTPPGGIVSVRMAQLPNAPEGKGLYEIRVKDNGIGMTRKFAEKIFEPFERERSTTVSKIQGTGLGMAISKNIVSMMGGTIEVFSEQGKGTEFVIRLSLRLQSERRSIEKIKELEGLKALVVDDDFNTCDSVTKMLVQVGMRSEWTLSGKEAVLRAKQSLEINDAFRAYIIDWRLPDMNGLEVTRRIRGLGDDTPIIILTAYDWSDIEEEAKAAGVTAFCSKPMFMSDLRETLLTALGHQQNEPESVLPASDVTPGFRDKRLLLVEDNEMNREIATEILGGFGFLIDTACNGAEAVEKVASSRPGEIDLILMDIQMPVMDGMQATKCIRALADPVLSSIPILAMTANAFDEDRRAAAACGMNGFLSKPIDMTEVVQTLKSVLDKK